MSDELIEIEEEEFTSQLTSPVMKRIGGLLKPHWKWVVGFLIHHCPNFCTGCLFHIPEQTNY